MKSTNRLALASGAVLAIIALIPISPVAAASKGLKKIPTTAATEPAKMAPATATVSLTRAECRGLGGTAHYTIGCGEKDQATCVIVDQDGVVKTMCIDEAKK